MAQFYDVPLSLVVFINGLASPKLESVKIPTSFPFKYTDLIPVDFKAKDTIGVDNRSPKDKR